MHQVTKKEFFTAVGDQNVHPTQVGSYPYTSVFRNPSGVEVGRIEPVGDGPNYEHRYTLGNLRKAGI